MASHAAAPSHNPQRSVLLESTGLIGTQTFEVLSRLGEYAPRVAALAAGGSHPELLARQAITWKVPVLAVIDGEEDLAGRLRQALRPAATQVGRPSRVITIFTGPDVATAAVQAAELKTGDAIVNGITDSVRPLPMLVTLTSGARLALINKESLVVGDALVCQALTRPDRTVPVDFEHSAIAQALTCGHHEKGLTSPVLSGRSEVRRLVLTASGSPFRGRSRAELTRISAAAALKHLTWDMGLVVTINSSTLISKGPKLTKTHLLFDVVPERIDVIVHPQSVIHSMVEFVDSVITTQASPPDMRLLIALGLAWSERPDLSGLVTPNDWREPISWTFEPLDDAAFPVAGLACSAAATSDTRPIVFNAANEQAIAASLVDGLEWLDIIGIDAAIVGEHKDLTDPGLDDVLAVETRVCARVDGLIAARDGGTHL